VRRQITKISILQSSKIVTILYVILGFIYVPIGLAMIVFGSEEFQIMGFVYLGMPLVMAVFGFVFFVIGAWLYNVIAGMVGGFEVYVDHIDPPPTFSPE
jgi:hypothetical protein